MIASPCETANGQHTKQKHPIAPPTTPRWPGPTILPRQKRDRRENRDWKPSAARPAPRPRTLLVLVSTSADRPCPDCLQWSHAIVSHKNKRSEFGMRTTALRTLRATILVLNSDARPS